MHTKGSAPAGILQCDCLSLSLSVCWHSRGKLSFVCLACADEAHKQTIGVAGRHDGADRVSDKWQVKSLTVCFYHHLVSVGFPPVSQRWPLCAPVYVRACVYVWIKIVCIQFSCLTENTSSHEQSADDSDMREKTFSALSGRQHSLSAPQDLRQVHESQFYRGGSFGSVAWTVAHWCLWSDSSSVLHTELTKMIFIFFFINFFTPFSFKHG